MATTVPPHLTPEQWLENHELVRIIRRAGVTEAQIQGMRFRHTNQGWPFDFWSFEMPVDTPSGAVGLVKPYCALKWLILEDPPPSRDRDDAWRLVADATAAPTFRIGERTRSVQQERARKSRGKVTEDGQTITQLIAELALQPSHRAETAKELWPHFFAVLDRQELYPQEFTYHNNPQKYGYSYVFNGRQKTISFARFANAVSKARSKKNHVNPAM